MKQFIAIVFVFVLISSISMTTGCKKSSPSSPATTATPIATILVDNFEDADLVDSILPLDATNNTWGNGWDGHSNLAGPTITGAPGGIYGADALGTTSNLIAAVATPTSQYYGFNCALVNLFTNYGSSAGLSITAYTDLNFGFITKVTTAPTNGTRAYIVLLYQAGTGHMIEAPFTPTANNWQTVTVPLSSFIIWPQGTSGFTVGDVLANVTNIAFYYYIYSPTQNDTATEINCIDNIVFRKF